MTTCMISTQSRRASPRSNLFRSARTRPSRPMGNIDRPGGESPMTGQANLALKQSVMRIVIARGAYYAWAC